MGAPKVAALTLPLTAATGGIGFPRFADGVPIMARRGGGVTGRSDGDGEGSSSLSSPSNIKAEDKEEEESSLAAEEDERGGAH